MQRQKNLALLTDLYQLTMAQAYFREQRLAEATFSLFTRSYPTNRGYFVAGGLSDVLDYLEDFSFDNAALDNLVEVPNASDCWNDCSSAWPAGQKKHRDHGHLGREQRPGQP